MTTKSADILIADAIVSELNAAVAGTFSQTFTAERVYVPVNESQDVVGYSVQVAPSAIRCGTLSRESVSEEYDTDIAIQVQCDPYDVTTGDSLRYLSQQIRDFFARRSLEIGPSWLRASVKIYSPERLLNNRRFLTVITITHTAAR